MTQEQEALRARAKELEAAALKEGYERGNYREAIRLNQQLQEVARALKDSYLEHKALLRAAEAERALGNVASALTMGQQVRAFDHEKRHELDGAVQAESCLFLAALFEKQGKYSEARRAVQQGEALAITSNNSFRIAGFFTAAGQMCGTLRDIDLGLEYLERAEALYRAMGRLKSIPSVIHMRYAFYANTKQFTKALEICFESLKLSQQLGDWKGEMLEYGTIGGLYGFFKESEKALTYYLQGLQLARKHEDPLILAQFLTLTSTVYHNMGNIGEALSYNEQAYQEYKKNGNLMEQYSALMGRASLFRDQGRYAEALQVLNQLLSEVRAHRKEMESWVLHSIGSVYSRKGDSTRACAYFEKVLQIHRAENNREREASTLMSLALESIHQPAKVRLYLQQAKTIYQERRDRPWEVDTLSQFGYLERRIGNKQAAEHSYQQAIALVESLRHGAGNGLSSQGAFFEGISYPYVGYLTLLVEEGRAGEAFALVQKTKARGLLDLMASGKIDLSRQLTQTEREQERQRRDRCDTLSTAMVREAARNEPGSKKRFEATRLELAKAERELSLFQDTLYAKHTGLGQHRGATTVDLAQVAKTLPANAALLEFAPLDNGQMALFVVTRSSQGKALVTMAQLAMSINELEGHITALRTACTSPKKPWQGEAKRLYQALLARVETRLRGKSQLILCPDRGLWDVPFAVLTDKTGTPLLERFALSYANSATTWHAAQTTPRKPSASPKLLVLANPQFDAEKRFENGPQVPGQRPITVPDRPITAPNRPITVPDRPITVPDRPITVPDRPLTVPDRDLYVPRGTKLVDLPGTQREADALAKRFPGATVYTRGKAQESVMKQSASQFQRIHLASHAFVNDAAPLLSSIVLANPTLGSGDDGFLTAREIFEIDLSGVELVVLSACNTARGAKRGGEGVVGLTWALFAAGCPTQVLSQWAVDDSSTATLMTYFYEGLAKGKGKSAALRQAALSLRKSAKYTHPYFWAPFVLIGDPH